MVSVVVPHFDDLRSLDLCLTDLCGQTFPAEAFEIIVADNASTAGTQAVAAVIAGRARLTTVHDKGAGPARNGGAALARGDILAFTDCDCRPDPGWLAAGVAALSQYDIVGGRMLVSVDDREHMTPTEAFEAVFAFNNQRYVTQLGFTVTANLFCEKALFEAVGGYRVGLSEDVEWCRRATKMGYRLGYAPLAAVSHPARKTWADLLKKWRRTNKEAYELYASRRGGLLIYLARSSLMPLSAVLHTPAVLMNRSVPNSRQKWAAVGVLFKLRLWRFADSLKLVISSGGG
jgi:glycosyltransferase involved in cell wall biosynthesis